MSEKTCKLTIKVDEACRDCSKKIQKILCKLQGQENITIWHDEKTNTVTISGTFDAQKIYKKLCCNVITGFQITVQGQQKPPPPPPPPKEEHCSVTNNIKIMVCGRTCHGGCRIILGSYWAELGL